MTVNINDIKKSRSSRLRILVVLLPVAAFALLYLLACLVPNYLLVTPSTERWYMLEYNIFGMLAVDGSPVVMAQYFRYYHWLWMDMLSPVLFLLALPLPLYYAVHLQRTAHSSTALRITCVMFIATVICGLFSYALPTAPPWYVVLHGAEVKTDVEPFIAGFLNLDKRIGIPLCATIYRCLPSTFASAPAVMITYACIAFFYSFQIAQHRLWQIGLGVFTFMLVASAIYSGHHYIIDVLLAIIIVAISILLFEIAVHHYEKSKTIYWKVTFWLLMPFDDIRNMLKKNESTEKMLKEFKAQQAVNADAKAEERNAKIEAASKAAREMRKVADEKEAAERAERAERTRLMKQREEEGVTETHRHHHHHKRKQSRYKRFKKKLSEYNPFTYIIMAVFHR